MKVGFIFLWIFGYYLMKLYPLLRPQYDFVVILLVQISEKYMIGLTKPILQLLKNRGLDNNIVANNLLKYHVILYLLFLPIAYVFGVFVGVFLITLIVVSSFLFLNVRKDREDFLEYFALNFIYIILAILLINMVATNYYFCNFNIKESELKVAIGTASYQELYDPSLSLNDVTFFDTYYGNDLMKSNITSDYHNQILEIRYHSFDNGKRRNKINLIYEIRRGDRVYVDYQKQLNYYHGIYRKTILFLILSMILYAIAMYLSVLFSFKNINR